MKISLVIPAYNEEKIIGTCLESVLKYGGSKIDEIIVVDNASKDRTAEVARSFRGVRVVYEAQKGLTCARAAGLSSATGDLIAYIDADTRLRPGWVETVRQVFDSQPKAVCLSGPYRYHDGSWHQKIIMTAVWFATAPIVYRIVGYMVLGGNFVAKKSALLAMGGFDRTIDFYGEDTDIARRLSKFGKVVFRMDFYIYSSLRRLKQEGLMKTNLVYALNFLWPVIFHRPFTKRHSDVRI